MNDPKYELLLFILASKQSQDTTFLPITSKLKHCYLNDHTVDMFRIVSHNAFQISCAH